MRLSIATLLAASCLACLEPRAYLFAQDPPQAADEQTAPWRPLFNGRDLAGWRLVNTPEDTWSFQDGVLRCSGKPIGEIRTEQMYQNFEMEIEWRHLVPGGNAGIFVWADDLTARGVPFHRGIEVQVLENDYGNTNSHTTHGDIFPIHGADMQPVNGRGGKRAFPTEFRSNPSPEWNHYRIVCQDGAISLAVNGKVVTRGEQANPRKGYICIESEGGVVEYRNGRIRELQNNTLDPSMVAIADRGFHSIYSGLDLRGWQISDRGAADWRADDWVLRYTGNAGKGQADEQASTISMEFGQPTSQKNGSQGIDGLIIDFRLPDNTSGLKLKLPGTDRTLEVSPHASSPFAQHLEPPGKWNRLEVMMEASKMIWRVNGNTLEPPPADLEFATGLLSIIPGGPLELANLYVRAAN